jgi:surfactin synthase thioesterase subunit
MAETPLRDLSQVVEEIASAIAADSDLPFDFFGHILGGLLAFEVARTFAARGLRQPDHLIVSGCEAPARRSRGKAVHLFSDAELIGELRALNGTPPEVLANRDLMALLLPVLRADFTLVYDYAYRPGLPLRMPVTVLAGSRDPRCQAENMQCWLDESSAGGALHWIDGDHFFIHAQQDAVLEKVRQVLET